MLTRCAGIRELAMPGLDMGHVDVYTNIHGDYVAVV